MTHSPRLTRRALLGWAGAAGATAAIAGVGALRPLTARADPPPVDDGDRAEGAVCVLTPAAMQGPYYLADEAIRRDIREDRGGELLRLVLTVVAVPGCAPLEGATVEIWHADRKGRYSGFGATTAERTFLRGGQVTDAAGRVRFTTVYPGWYPGRCAHIHVKVHAGGDVVHTGQLYFPQRLNERIYAQPRYQHAGAQVTNRQDAIFVNSGGSQTKLAMSRSPGGGHKGVITLGVAA